MVLKINDEGIELIKHFEGYQPCLYKDIAGHYTIGYGHKIALDKLDFFQGQKLSQQQATKLLINDLVYWQSYINQVITDNSCNLNENQFSALCSFCFNLGHFVNDMLLRFKNKDLKAVGDSLLLYNKVRINGNLEIVEGLKRRRIAERNLFFKEVH